MQKAYMRVHPGDLIVGSMMVGFIVVGALLARHALDVEMSVFGISLIGFGVLFLLGQVRRHFAVTALPEMEGQHG